MLKLFLSVLPLALAAAWSPTRFSISVYNVSSDTKPILRGLVYFFGTLVPVVMISSFLFLIVLQVNDSVTFHNLIQTNKDSYVNFVLGILFIVSATIIYLWQRNLRGKTIPKQAVPTDSKTHVMGIFWLGFTMTALSLSTIIFMIPAINTIGLASETIPVKVIVLALFDGIIVLPMFIPILLVRMNPSLIDRYLQPMARWINAHAYTMIIAILYLIGSYLILMSILHYI